MILLTRHRGAVLVLLAAVAMGVALAARRRLRNRPRSGRQRALSRRPGPTTQSLVTVTPADMSLGEPGHNTELRLDEALQETFPGSDPIATQIE